jgi:hypothetical protein
METPYHRTSDFLAPKNVFVEKRGENLVVTEGDQSITLPTSIFKEAHKLPGLGLATYFAPQSCFLAVHGDRGFAYSLFSIDRKSVKTNWKTDVWANDLKSANGRGHHYVSITTRSNRVILFGCASDGLYLEIYSEKGGENLMRFSTAY